MRHAERNRLEAGSIGALAVAVIQPAFLTGLVTGPGGPAGAPAGDRSTLVLAVHLPTVAPPAEVEDRPAKSAPDFTIAVVHRVRPQANARESLTTGMCGGRLNSNVGVRKNVGTGARVLKTRVPTSLTFAIGVLPKQAGLARGSTRARKGQKHAELEGRSQGPGWRSPRRPPSAAGC